jgi:hypothetical protein
MSSFISERTAEFYLVPRFKSLLGARYSFVLPFFYWKTREGGILSRGDNFPKLVTACAMFPRRPKVLGQRIEMTVNEEVYLMSEHLQQARIPTFLGFPNVGALSEFATDFECFWFSPTSLGKRYTHHEMVSSHAPSAGSTLLGPFEDETTLCEYIEVNGIQQAWCSLLDSLFEVHSKISGEKIIANRFRFGPPYKPVYFVMW